MEEKLNLQIKFSFSFFPKGSFLMTLKVKETSILFFGCKKKNIITEDTRKKIE
jgi:hypothetical protein